MNAAYLEQVRAADGGELERDQELGVLGLRAGQRVLDVGCGLGDDVLTLARTAGATGAAIGIDTNGEFIWRARRRAAASGSRATFVRADAHALPFVDGTFDAVRCERTLQHVEDPAAVLHEMARVLRPGGVVAVSEPDWSTLVIDVEPRPVTQRVVEAFRGLIRNPRVGGEAVRLMAGAGLDVMSAAGDSLVIRDARAARRLLWLDDAVAGAVAAGLPRAVATAWLAELDRRGREGTCFAACVGFLVVARKPG